MWMLLSWLACAPQGGPGGRAAPPHHDSAAPTEVTVSPSLEAPRVVPHEPLPSQPLHCDAEGASWRVNGAPWDGGEQVPAGVTQAGDRWTCTVDGRESPQAVVRAPGGNVLVILLDDIGLDKVGYADAHPQPSPTPNIDQLAAEGMVFDAAYAYPSCSPTRAAIMTGRSGWRTGVGNGIHLDKDTYALPESELTLAELVRAAPGAAWSSSFVGKWHLASRRSSRVLTNPLDQGFDHWEGSLTNLDLSWGHAPVQTTYDYWEKVIDGTPEWVESYATIDTTDDAIRRVQTLDEPWLLHVSYNASHTPLTPPPEDLHDFGPLTYDTPQIERFDAVTQALDAQLGRLLVEVDPSTTTVFLLSDNGTTENMIREPWDPTRGKLTLYEGGTHVPFVAWGALVEQPGSRSEAFVHVLDLFPTLADIAGVRWHELAFDDGRPRPIDGLSLLPYLLDPTTSSQRETIVTSKFAPNGGGPYTAYDEVAIRSRDWKYMDTLEGERFFRMEPGRFDEGDDLLVDGPEALDAKAEAALVWLRSAANRARDTTAYAH